MDNEKITLDNMLQEATGAEPTPAAEEPVT
jgi:hypothetical protein